MKLTGISCVLVGACLGATASLAFAQHPRAEDVTQPAPPPAWIADADGHCRLKIYVDDRATVRLQGDRIEVDTQAGRRSYDEGSTCDRPLPHHAISDFRVTAAEGRGHIVDVRPPSGGNDFTGSIALEDPAPLGSVYVLDIAWNDVPR